MIRNILFVLALVVCYSSQCSAYEIIYSDDGESPTRWCHDDVNIVLDESLSAFGRYGEVEDVMWEAFEVWIAESNLPLVFSLKWGFCATNFDDGFNCVSARALPGADADGEIPGALGHAVRRRDFETGCLADVDIVFFSENATWTISDEVGKHSLMSVAMHEIGHLIGLGHSGYKNAVLYPTIPPVQKNENYSLSLDDINAIDELYGEKTCPPAPSCSVVSGVAPGHIRPVVSLLQLL